MNMEEIYQSIEHIAKCEMYDAIEVKYLKSKFEQLQQENQELKLELLGYRQAILKDKEMLGLKEQNKKYKEVIDKAIEYTKKNIHSYTLEKILKGDKE